MSHYQHCLGRAGSHSEGALVSDDHHSNSGPEVTTEAEMASTSVADDAPSVNIKPESVVPPPGEEQTHTMDVDEPNDSPPPASLVSQMEDNLLMGGEAVGVEGEMSQLQVSSPGHQKNGDGDTSI